MKTWPPSAGARARRRRRSKRLW